MQSALPILRRIAKSLNFLIQLPKHAIYHLWRTITYIFDGVAGRNEKAWRDLTVHFPLFVADIIIVFLILSAFPIRLSENYYRDAASLIGLTGGLAALSFNFVRSLDDARAVIRERIIYAGERFFFGTIFLTIGILFSIGIANIADFLDTLPRLLRGLVLGTGLFTKGFFLVYAGKLASTGIETVVRTWHEFYIHGSPPEFARTRFEPRDKE